MADICSRRNATNVQSIDVFDNERLDEEVLTSDGEASSVQYGAAPPGVSAAANSRLSSLRPYVSGVLPCCVTKNEVTECPAGRPAPVGNRSATAAPAAMAPPIPRRLWRHHPRTAVTAHTRL